MGEDEGEALGTPMGGEGCWVRAEARCEELGRTEGKGEGEGEG